MNNSMLLDQIYVSIFYIWSIKMYFDLTKLFQLMKSDSICVHTLFRIYTHAIDEQNKHFALAIFLLYYYSMWTIFYGYFCFIILILLDTMWCYMLNCSTTTTAQLPLQSRPHFWMELFQLTQMITIHVVVMAWLAVLSLASMPSSASSASSLQHAVQLFVHRRWRRRYRQLFDCRSIHTWTHTAFGICRWQAYTSGNRNISAYREMSEIGRSAADTKSNRGIYTAHLFPTNIRLYIYLCCISVPTPTYHCVFACIVSTPRKFDVVMIYESDSHK